MKERRIWTGKESAAIRRGLVGFAALVSMMVGLVLLVYAFPSGQPTCNGQAMRPGDTCDVYSWWGLPNNWYEHEETYADRVKQIQYEKSTRPVGVALVLGPLFLLGVFGAVAVYKTRPVRGIKRLL